MTFAALLVAAQITTAFAQSDWERKGLIFDRRLTPEQERAEAAAAKKEREAAVTREVQAREIGARRHPWRLIDGKTNSPRSLNWVRIEGKAVRVLKDEVTVDGFFSGAWTTAAEKGNGLFVVKHFTFVESAGEEIPASHWHMALPVAWQTNRTGKVIRVLDYGIPCAAPAPATNAVAK